MAPHPHPPQPRVCYGPHPGPLTLQLDPDEIKKHDLCLRYKTAAERAFQRDFRLLEQFCKAHPAAPTPKPAEPEPASNPKPQARLTVVGEDPTSPTGLTLLLENIGGVETRPRTPYYPPPESPPNRPPP